jgi:hypothetical protein
MISTLTRRGFVGLLGGVPFLVGSRDAVAANGALISRLIDESRSHKHVSERIEFISRSLLGVRYQANTLIGGPTSPERFVVREDAFDCVTFCEVVLASAIAANLAEFETALRKIRYDHGKVQWDQRNHYFADWCQRNVDNKICGPVTIEPSVKIDKTVNWHRALGKRQVSINAVTKETLLGNAKLLAPGDIIGFTSRRSDLDFFHTGFIAFAKNGDLLLRHASQSRGRVIDEKMSAFVMGNMVKHVALVRPSEDAQSAAIR